MPDERTPHLRLIPPSANGDDVDDSAHEDAEDGATERNTEDEPPWQHGAFYPFYRPQIGDYVADGGETFRLTSGDPEHICGFVAEPQGEVSTVHDLDEPTKDVSRVVTIRFTTPSGDAADVNVAIENGKSLPNLIIDAVPTGIARFSVSRRSEVGRAAAALTAPAYISRTRYGQTGWVDSRTFAFAGSDDVSFERLGDSPGISLLSIPPVPDPPSIARGLEVLLRLLRVAALTVTAGLLGTIAAGPMFRRKSHLGARACTTLLAGPTGAGKTLLTSTLYSLLGDFRRQPGCITTWRTTLPTLEAYLHVLRDQAVYIDNFRLMDEGVKERFRDVVIAVGDGVARGKSVSARGGVRVVGALAANSLVLATGEDSFADDAAVCARILEFPAHDIDREALLKITAAERACLPHVYSAFIHYLAAQSVGDWAQRRALMNQLAAGMSARAPARTSEHLALIAVAFATFCEFALNADARSAPAWAESARAFAGGLTDLALQQARRVTEERIDGLVLREIARAIREGKASLVPLGPTQQPARGTVLGAYDADAIYLVPDVTAKWAKAELRAAGRGLDAVGRKGLAWALKARGGDNGEIKFQTINERRTRTWRVRRPGLDECWDGLLDGVPTRRGKALDDPKPEGEA